MKKLISLLLITIIVTSMTYAYGEGSFNFFSAQSFTLKFKRVIKISIDAEIPADSVMQNGPNSYAINLAEIGEDSSEYSLLSVFFR